jgi:hypothetical protein
MLTKPDYLIKRGIYPIYNGNAVFDAMENWGLRMPRSGLAMLLCVTAAAE